MVRQGRTLAKAGDPKSAIDAFGKALSDPALPLKAAAEPLLGLASVYRAQKRLDEAIAYARLVHQTSPNDAQALALIGRIEKDRGNLEHAIEAMKRAAQLDPALRPDLAELEKLRP